jgi:hypothetical protein
MERGIMFQADPEMVVVLARNMMNMSETKE